MKFGIDLLGFYTPNYYVDLATVANERGVAVEKFYTGLGQNKMAVPAPDEDIVTMGANAALKILPQIEVDKIDALLFATESGVDFSKAAGLYLHKLLQLPARCRVLELKQACYSATAALQIGLAMLQQQPTR
ncbi:MAG: hydroxymethylglutaryl-CoA synthase, partial [Gammaproteobacteria bacterium]|nr:hydroxymethylglutaryl-CoA synthase [Gammaproteobacteria bacterium]